MAWIISILLFGITSVCAGFYSGNWRNIQNTPWRLVKKICDTYIWCVILIYIGWRMQGWLKGQSHILKTAIMVPRKRLSRAIAATFWPRGRRALRPRGPNVKKLINWFISRDYLWCVELVTSSVSRRCKTVVRTGNRCCTFSGFSQTVVAAAKMADTQKKPDLGLLEEDDEFEEFPAEGML